MPLLSGDDKLQLLSEVPEVPRQLLLVLSLLFSDEMAVDFKSLLAPEGKRRGCGESVRGGGGRGRGEGGRSKPSGKILEADFELPVRLCVLFWRDV